MKKVIVFGGGTGLSCLLSGLKQFPIDVTTVITVSDNGSSTGILKKELDIPAVGDVGKVLISMANVDEDFVQLLRYRFSKDGSLYNHPVRNIMLAALIDLKGSLSEATAYMSKLLNRSPSATTPGKYGSWITTTASISARPSSRRSARPT